MIPSKNCLALISSDGIEGFESAPYPDSGGVATIGYGTTFYPNGTRVTFKDEPITKEQAWSYLEYHCNMVAKQIEPLIKVKLNQNQIDALITFVYNIGIGEFKTSTLLKVINKTPYDFLAVKNQWLRWVYDDGVKKNGLIKRRNVEFLLYSKPV